MTASSSEPDLDNPEYFFNRELSMLEFQRRVLEEAEDENNPLLERVKFIAILGSNLDEFFMVRVAGLRKLQEAGLMEPAPDGLTPGEQLAAIRKTAHQLMSEARETWRDDLLPMLHRAGIHILDYAELSERQQALVDQYFEQVVFPVLTPLAFDPGHPFPHISNLSLNLAVVIRDQDGEELFARLKVPDTLPRLVPLKRVSGEKNPNRGAGSTVHNHYFVWLEQVIAANLDRLFPGLEVVESYPFRITRDADTEIQELEAPDLLESIDQAIRQRRFGNVVRMTVNLEMPSRIREILAENLELDRRDIYALEGPLGLSSLMALRQIDRADLKDPPFKQSVPIALRSGTSKSDSNIFAAIRKQDILLHHPYDSFLPVVEFLNQAAQDPNVLAIKQTLYRVGRNSPVVHALLEARERDKQVAVLVELKARFDEESNIGWARMLERAGVHVIYGLLGLKTHSKIALVVRKEGENIRRYVHLATGNYNAVTAQIYEDLGMFTADDYIGADATDLFNYLTGYSSKSDYNKLLVAPINLRQGMMDLIRGEIEVQRRGTPGHLIFKMNSLVDPPMIQALYQASRAGVKVDLIIRGMCCLRPGIPKISENIRVRSIVGRFLEHSRIYYAHHGGEEKILLGSADLMPRNINRRVEVLFPVQDESLLRYLKDQVLETYLADNLKARLMNPDGSYYRNKPAEGEPWINSQEWLLSYHQKLPSGERLSERR
jgi:polyphosphate kinase